jgi:hypothetical protein
LQHVFQSRSEALQFQTCLALSQEFDDVPAWLFLIEQTQSKEPLRAASAQSRLAGLAQTGKPASADLIGQLRPLLASDTLQLRWGAAKVLGTHSGRDVIDSLLPLIADKEQSVADEACRAIVKQKDGALARDILAMVGKNHADPDVRSKATQLLAQLNLRSIAEMK